MRQQNRNPFVQQASLFEDFVIRCVRYAFANIPAKIGAVFFSRPVALPFLRFRLLRHGYVRSPISWQDVEQGSFKGILIAKDPKIKPDLVIYYAHGGGFSMGSSYFYLEYLLSWTHLLHISGFKNPAILALEYTLVPEAHYPAQLNQALAGYNYILQNLVPSTRVCVAGDSAGATIMLSLLLHLSQKTSTPPTSRPAMAIMISPWTTLDTPQHKNTPSDYLDSSSLSLYAKQYASTDELLHDPLVSPGECSDINSWKRAMPSRGFFFMWGKEEVFAPEIRKMLCLLRKVVKQDDFVNGESGKKGPVVEGEEAVGGIHAWPVASLFLSSTTEFRLKGLRSIVARIRERLLEEPDPQPST